MSILLSPMVSMSNWSSVGTLTALTSTDSFLILFMALTDWAVPTFVFLAVALIVSSSSTSWMRIVCSFLTSWGMLLTALAKESKLSYLCSWLTANVCVLAGNLLAVIGAKEPWSLLTTLSAINDLKETKFLTSGCWSIWCVELDKKYFSTVTQLFS